MYKIHEKIEKILKRHETKKLQKLRSEFLPEAMEIIEKPVSPLGPFVIIVTAAIVVVFGIWSILGKMDEVVTARGKIITVNGIQNVQTVNGGRIQKICVEEGTYVEAGQPILYLDSTVQEITLKSTSDSLELLKFENQLLELALKQKDLSDYIDNKEQTSERKLIAEYVMSMQKEYKAQAEELNNGMQQAMMQVEMEKKELEKLANSKEYLSKQKEISDDNLEKKGVEDKNAEKIEMTIMYKEKELADYENLYELGAISLAEVEKCRQELELLKMDYEIQKEYDDDTKDKNVLQEYEMEYQITSTENQYSNQQKAVELATAKCQQIEKNQENLKAQYEEKIATLIRENDRNINAQEANQELQAVSIGEQILVSPVNGVVKTLEVNTVGGVLTTGEVVATVVPEGTQILAEIDILNQDIGCVQAGQKSAIKLDAYNFQDYGKLEGTIVSVSPDAIWDDGKGWIYKGKVCIEAEKFQYRNEDTEIVVGMEGTAEVKVDERRILEFFLEPLIEHFDGSLKIK